MTLEQYMIRYRLLQRAVEQDEQLLILMEQAPYAAFLRRFGSACRGTPAPRLLTPQSIRDRMRRRGRLCSRYAERIARAVALIHAPVIRQYAVCRYLYGMTQEDISRKCFYSLRTVYRQGARAKDAMERAMRVVSPRPARTKSTRYRSAAPLPRRDYSVTNAERAAARYQSVEEEPARIYYEE
ncbi:MAG: hypothetical protein J6Z79_03510 [Clostridia bacterium]|nr:hypothetical protein [Clostridia bacterium]